MKSKELMAEALKRDDKELVEELYEKEDWSMSEIADILKEIGDERPKVSWNFGTIWKPDEFLKFLKDSCENMKNDDYDGDRC